MRVLWISNIEIKEDLKSSGSWIYAMAHAFLSIEEITLGNIVPVRTKAVTSSDFKTIKQWKIPAIKKHNRTFLTLKEKSHILEIASLFRPDIIHIWGIENGYALITEFIKCPVLVEIQGINSEISKHYYGGLSYFERLKLIGLRELLTINPLSRQKQKFTRMKAREARILEINRYFTTPTEWMRANVEVYSPKAKYFSNGFILRDDFYNSKAWGPNENSIILASASDVVPYKGLHILIDAISILKIRFSGIRLLVIGPYFNKGIRTRAYFHYLKRKVRKYGLEDRIIWLGSLSAKEICESIQKSSVFVNPSFIESAGMTVLEAMALGIPVVSSFTGGIPTFNSGAVLYFAPGDYKMCAFQISKALSENELNNTGIALSRSYIGKYHSREQVIIKQLDIYKSVLEENKGL